MSLHIGRHIFRGPARVTGCAAAFLLSCATLGAAEPRSQNQSAYGITITQAKPGNIFVTSEKVEIPVTTSADSVAWTVTDFLGRVTRGKPVDMDAEHRAIIHPGSGRKGYFELHLEAKRAGATVAHADTTFAVVAPLDVGKMADSPFGVMTHFAQGWNTDLMPLIARAGLRQIRDEQYWEAIESIRGLYSFNSGFRAYMAAAAANKLDPLIELTFGNNLYDHDPANPDVAWAPVTDAGRNGFARYAQAVLAQYGSQMNTVEVWNEYNGSWCAGPAAANRPENYTRMLRATYEAVKARRPDVRVLGGAPVLAPQPWFEDLFRAGALDYMDAAVIHPYYALPEDVEKPVIAIQDAMRRYNHGAGAKPIWATETSFSDTAHRGRQDMARALVRALTTMRVDGVERIYWYLMRDYNDFATGLVRSENDPLGRYVPTAAYPAYSNLIAQLYHARFVRREVTDRRTRLYLFDHSDHSDKAGAQLRVLWSTAPPTRLLLATTKPLTLIDLMGESTVRQPQGGVVAIAVDDNPVYVVGEVDSVREDAPNILLADSAADFNGVQGATPGSWSYGYCLASEGGGYPGDHFKPMAWTRTDYNYCWECPYAYALLSDTVASPSRDGNTPVWAVRRWQSASAGTARITGTASHVSQGGDGAGVKIFVDGSEVFSATIGAPGGPGSASFDVGVTLRVGSLVDFAVTPGPGTNIDFDTVDYRARITQP